MPGEQAAGGIREHVAPCPRFEHRGYVPRVQDREGDRYNDRQPSEEGARHPPLSGERLRLPLDLEALPDGVGDVVEHLCEITADILCDQDADLEKRDVRSVDSL